MKQKESTLTSNALIEAAVMGGARAVKSALMTGTHSATDLDDATRWAIINDHPTIVGQLLLAGADGYTALRDAAHHGKTKALRIIMAAGSNNVADCDMALRWAAAHGHAKAVRFLLGTGVDVNADDGYVLRWSAFHGHADVVRVLLAAGADVHVNVDNPLRAAVAAGRLGVVQILLGAGADVHARCDAALRWAALEHHEATVRVLLAAGADPVVALQNVGGGDEAGDVAAMLDACADMLPTAQRAALAPLSERFVRVRAALAASRQRQIIQR